LFFLFLCQQIFAGFGKHYTDTKKQIVEVPIQIPVYYNVPNTVVISVSKFVFDEVVVTADTKTNSISITGVDTSTISNISGGIKIKLKKNYY